ncbi:MAG: sulfotransferase family protein [Arenicella sp.]|nr:sulfotransferase family protein [Arenicella sp.]
MSIYDLKQTRKVLEESKYQSPFYQLFNGTLPPNIVDMKTAISFDYQYVYSRIPKAANSTVVASLYKKETGNDIDDYAKDVKEHYFLKLSSLSEKELKQLKQFFKFTIVRNPIARLRSAYLDKILSGEKIQVQKFFNISSKTKINFDLFLDFLEQGGINDNSHWAPQKNLLYFPIDDYDYIGKVETLEKDMEVVLGKIYQSRGTVFSICKRRTGKIDFTVSNSQKKRIYQLYEQDFECFSYSL